MERRLALDIQGMTCEHCVRAVRNALGGMDGVRVEEVHVGAATVVYDPDRATPDAIVDAVNDEGYAAVKDG